MTAGRHDVRHRHRERRAITARGTALTGLAVEAALGLDAFVAGEFFKTVRLGFPLRPRRLEEVFQVEVEFGSSAHEKWDCKII